MPGDTDDNDDSTDDETYSEREKAIICLALRNLHTSAVVNGNQRLASEALAVAEKARGTRDEDTMVTRGIKQ